MVGIVVFAYQATYAEVYDLDALTDGYTNVTETETTNVNASSTKSTKPDETNTNNAITNADEELTNQALNLAECLIFKKLEVEDAKCNALFISLQCPDYATYLTQRWIIIASLAVIGLGVVGLIIWLIVRKLQK